jgi:hypothetical protein
MNEENQLTEERKQLMDEFDAKFKEKQQDVAQLVNHYRDKGLDISCILIANDDSAPGTTATKRMVMASTPDAARFIGDIDDMFPSSLALYCIFKKAREASER